jgi:hypothetical protein
MDLASDLLPVDQEHSSCDSLGSSLRFLRTVRLVLRILRVLAPLSVMDPRPAACPASTKGYPPRSSMLALFNYLALVAVPDFFSDKKEQYSNAHKD